MSLLSISSNMQLFHMFTIYIFFPLFLNMGDECIGTSQLSAGPAGPAGRADNLAWTYYYSRQPY